MALQSRKVNSMNSYSACRLASISKEKRRLWAGRLLRRPSAAGARPWPRFRQSTRDKTVCETVLCRSGLCLLRRSRWAHHPFEQARTPDPLTLRSSASYAVETRRGAVALTAGEGSATVQRLISSHHIIFSQPYARALTGPSHSYRTRHRVWVPEHH